ncbi:MAG: hypothetical protein KJN77_01255 [Gammaproteobacteria bacterium]|nr:hypothetical protein [Gammaproteobacteria bacterium]
MSRQIPFSSESVSLTVMLLMIVAVVAGQADATSSKTQAADASDATALAPISISAGLTTHRN